MITYRKKKKVFLNSQKVDLSPRVVNKRVITMERLFNNQEVERTYDVLEVELACFIDQRVLLDEEIADIRVFTSTKSLDEMKTRRNLIKESLDPSRANDETDSFYDRFNVNKSKSRNETKGEAAQRKRSEKESIDNLSKSQRRSRLLNVIYDVDHLNQNLTSERISGLQFLTKFNINQVLGPLRIKNIQNIKQTDEDLFGYREVFKIRRLRNPKFRKVKSSGRDISLEIPPAAPFSQNGLSLSRFKTAYFNQIKIGKDPLSNFSTADIATTVENRIGGNATLEKESYSELRESFKLFAKNKLDSSPEEDLGFKIRKEKIINRNRVIKTTFEMPRFKMRSLSRQTGFIDLIFFAFDKYGRRVDSFETRISLAELFLTEKNPNLDFSSYAVRTNKGNIVTKINNQELQDVYFNLYQKDFSKSQNYLDAIFTEENEDILVKAKNTVKLIDGKRKSTSRPSFSKTKTVFHRITSNFDGREISNTKSASVASLESENNQLTCAVYVLQDEESKTASVSISNLSEDVYAVLPVKRIVKGRRGNDFSPVKLLSNGQLVDNKKVFIDNNEISDNIKSFTFVDNDIEDDVIYEYAAFLYSRSGNKQLSGSRFLEKRVDKEGLIEANITSNVTNVSTFDTLSGQVKTKVDFEIELNRNEDDVDKIINSIFGDNRGLFNDDLSEIKDASNLLYGVRVHRINTKTGEYSFVGSFRGFKQKDPADSASTDIPKTYTAKFSDYAPSFSNQIYKIDPYVIPPSQVLDKVFNTLERIVKSKNRSRSTLNKMLVAKQKILNRDVISSIGTKYASIQGRKGAIASQTSLLERNRNDLFLEGVTGDIVYEFVNVGSGNRGDQDLEISKEKIKLIKTLDRDSLNYGYVPKQIANISFASNNTDALLDFYIVVKQFNKDPNITIDGVIHSLDRREETSEETSYNYLSELKTRVGLVRYYLFGVKKSGDLLGPAFLGSVFLEGE